ncbi:MAG: CBS domain-containing protein [Caldilineae bacterium]|nr:CBS domain-containing protein [Chloroflexota bacterium]MCB9177128.1 CBS domain-containing protein [Caldilineae bacterium]
MEDLLVRDIMTTDLISIDRHLKVAQALELMHAEGVRRLPVVVPGDRLVGIITEKDARLALPRVAEAGGLGGYDGLSYEGLHASEPPSVQDVMSHYVHTLTPNRSVAHAAELLAAHRISGLPVVEEGRLVGIVTAYDIYRLVADALVRPRVRAAA